MKKIAKIMFIAMSIAMFSSCKKDGGNLPNISFKTGGVYESSDVTLPVGSSVLIGINASKAEKRDVLKKFDVSTSINGGSTTSVYNKDMAKSEEDNYSYDYSTTLNVQAGQTCKYVFTITNRDGLTNQKMVTITAAQ